MKRWTIWLFLVTIGFSLAGCTQKTQSTANEQLPKNEAAFTWWSDRSKPFGEYNYTVMDEKQAQDDLENKFHVVLLPSFDKARELIKTDFLLDDVVEEPEEFTINATKRELRFSSQIKFKNLQGQYSSYGTVTAKYDYLEDQKKVRLSNQRIELYNATANEKYNGKNLDDTLKKLGTLLELDDLEQLLKNFKKETADQEKRKGKDIVIYEDFHEGQKKHLFGKSFGVEYNEFGVLEKIYGLTMDYRV
ncbi:hypothetical protein BCR24_07430 [Enterococcus ureilyticus]|uniref:Lipoprotein n=1 Tax=Enterococcus ureilyticus TaxID=1131292 RepID=A0A1E5H8N2_9ENTE|nr:hypothetical protein [Enterococcus ureilyticus]MBM7687453.1 hypothetical protein [Enterococcus ureilyticus]MBO0445106.1 hypothetical protein [Enterococcus ureilyticus]OEG21291.1 hypothetical protein BCR24_07430 [Enterococcus ureilyticus]